MHVLLLSYLVENVYFNHFCGLNIDHIHKLIIVDMCINYDMLYIHTGEKYPQFNTLPHLNNLIGSMYVNEVWALVYMSLMCRRQYVCSFEARV